MLEKEIDELITRLDSTSAIHAGLQISWRVTDINDFRDGKV